MRKMRFLFLPQTGHFGLLKLVKVKHANNCLEQSQIIN